MIETIFIIGLSVIAVLSIWNSYVLEAVHDAASRAVHRVKWPWLVYFFDCDECKSFWLCLIGSLIAGNIIAALPAYGVVLFWISINELRSTE